MKNKKKGLILNNRNFSLMNLNPHIQIGFFFFVFVLFSCKKKKDTVPSTPQSNVPATSWTTIHGLTGNEITDIQMDASGAVWISSAKDWAYPIDSVWYFNSCSAISKVSSNGAVIQKFDSLNSPVYNSKIRSFHFNAAGNLAISAYFNFGSTWIGSKLIIKENTYSVFDDTFATVQSTANFHSNSDGLWYSGGVGSLVNFNNGILTGYNSSNSIIQNNQILDITSTGLNGDFYFTTYKDLYLRSSGQFTNAVSNIDGVYLDTDSLGNLWILGNPTKSNSNYELIMYDGVDTTIYLTPIPHSSGLVKDFTIDSHDNKWIATYSSSANSNEGLYKWTGQTWLQYTPDNSFLHSSKLTKLKVDNSGNLWIGSFDKGVIQLNEFGTRN